MNSILIPRISAFFTKKGIIGNIKAICLTRLAGAQWKADPKQADKGGAGETVWGRH